MTQQNAPTKCPKCGRYARWNGITGKICNSDWHREHAAPPEGETMREQTVDFPEGIDKAAASPAMSAEPHPVQRHATETALDFKGEIEFVEDLENKRGIFAAPPEGETKMREDSEPCNSDAIMDLPVEAVASPAMNTESGVVFVGEVFDCPARSVVEESCVCKPGWGHRSFDVNAAAFTAEQAAAPPAGFGSQWGSGDPADLAPPAGMTAAEFWQIWKFQGEGTELYKKQRGRRFASESVRIVRFAFAEAFSAHENAHLRGEVARLTRERDRYKTSTIDWQLSSKGWKERAEQAEAEVARLRHQYSPRCEAHVGEKFDDCPCCEGAEVARLREQVRQLRRALQEIIEEEDLSLRVKPAIGYCLSKGASKRARAALESTTPQEEK